MSLFLTLKKRDEISDEIDELLMRQYSCRCKLDEAKQEGNEEAANNEKNKIMNYEKRIQKLKKKLS